MADQSVTAPPAGGDTGLRMSYEEFLTSYDGEMPAEWVDGRVVEMGPVTDEHDRISNYVGTLLFLYGERHQAGRVLREPFQMRASDEPRSRAPDVMFVTTEHLTRVEHLRLAGPADLVVEVISPSSFAIDRGEKFAEYERAGVPEYWLIDPERKRAEFYVRDGEGFYANVAPGPDGRYESAALPGLWIQVEWLWDSPPVLEVLRLWGILT